MLSILAQVEFAMEKTQLIYDMNTKELTNYEELYTEIGRLVLMFDTCTLHKSRKSDFGIN